MKYSFIIFLFISSMTVYGQFNEYYNHQLINIILADTIVDDWWYKEKISLLINGIESDKGLKEKMFPFSNYDKVIAYPYNEKYAKTENFKDYEKVFHKGKIKQDLNLVNGYILNEKQINDILDFVNNPINFNWGECGTPITFGLIVFYNKTQIISLIQLSCGYQQIDCYPKNIRIKLGSVDHKSSNWILNFVKEINID